MEVNEWDGVRWRVRCVCDVCRKDRDHMCHEWDGSKWRDYCYLHWNYEEQQSTLDKWLA